MIRHLLTGQVARGLSSIHLPLLCLLLLPLGLTAQAKDSLSHSKALVVKTVALNSVDASAMPLPPESTHVVTEAAKTENGKGAANPAPEPDTLMLLGTGVVVLALLYTRRRVRVLTPRAEANIIIHNVFFKAIFFGRFNTD